MKNEIYLRKAILSDLPEILTLFKETISSICKNDYTDKQIKAWIASVEDKGKWKKRIEYQFFLIAIIQDIIVGFGSIQDGDYLDVLFVHKDFQRRGIANKIYSALEKEAKKSGSTKIISNVSITAKPFFEKKGFLVIKEKIVELLHIEMTNYRMRKNI